MVKALNIKKQFEPDLFQLSDEIVGVGMTSSSPKINVYVENLTSEIVKNIPSEIKGIPVVVVEIGKLVAMQRTGRLRPAVGGISIGHFNITAGTLGCVVYDKNSGKRAILSNNHVLANQDAEELPGANKGDKIYQPGPYDGGRDADTLALLERWVKLKISSSNTVDCAIALPINDADLSDEIMQVGKLAGIATAQEGMQIKKSGRTTGLTSGSIIDANITVRVGYDIGDLMFADCFATTDEMCAGGDSGSAFCTSDNKLFGLLFAGNPSSGLAIGCKIQNVMRDLNVSLTPVTPTAFPIWIFGLLLIIPIGWNFMKKKVKPL